MASAVSARQAAPEISTSAEALGNDLRALRKSKGLTITELALRIGRSVGYISQVERGLSEVSIGDLRKFANALEVPVGWFFVHDTMDENEVGYVVRADSRRVIGSADSGLMEELLSPDLSAPFEMLRSVFEPGAEMLDEQSRDTDEAGYVVSGELELWIGERHFHLRAGDSFRFKREPYRWRNPGSEQAVVIWVIAPPVY